MAPSPTVWLGLNSERGSYISSPRERRRIYVSEREWVSDGGTSPGGMETPLTTLNRRVSLLRRMSREVNHTPEVRLRLDEARSLLDECRPILSAERYVRYSEGQSILRSVLGLTTAGPQGLAGLEPDELRDWRNLVGHAEANEFEAARQMRTTRHTSTDNWQRSTRPHRDICQRR